MAQIAILSGDTRFYVYEHLRADSGAIFYVGKGMKRRAFQGTAARRSTWCDRVVKKAGGFSVRMVAIGLDEELAHLVEVERINQLRSANVKLCNQTNGGDGVSGLKRSPEWCAMMSKIHKGKTIDEETRRKISESVKATGYKHPPEVIRAAAEKRRGMKPTLGMKHSEETKRKMSESRLGNKGRTGQKRSPEERAKASLALSGRIQTKQTCPHCGKVGGNVMKRYHFDFCKTKVA